MRLRCLLVAASVLALGSQGLAQGCEGWNTNLFFLSATLAEVESCLAAGADVNARVAMLGYTPLHLAARFTNDPAVIETLLDAGADVNAQDAAGLTPFIYAEHRVALKGTDAYRRLSETSRYSCAEWNTQEFFESTTLEEVRSCLAAGADVNARGEWGYTPLHFAAAVNNNPAVIRALVNAGADVNARGERGYTPLHLAAYGSDNSVVIEALLDAGADATAPDAGGNTPWDYAEEREELKGSDAYRRLSEAQTVAAEPTSRYSCAEWNTRAFFESATLAEVRSCLAAGADVNARDRDGDTPLHFAAAVNNNPAVIWALVNAGAEVGAQEDDYSATPLHFAAAVNNNPAIIRALVNAGAEVNAQSDGDLTPLHLAAYSSNNSAVIEALLNAGADATAPDAGGNTPWDYAEEREELKGSDAYRRLSEAQAVSAEPTSRYSCAEWNTRAFFESATLAEVRSCLAAGADVNARAGFDVTPLHNAASRTDNPAVIRALVAAGADVNARDRDGDTPLHNAAWSTNNPAVIEALLDAGADVGAQDALGRTPWDLARFNEALEATNAYRRLAPNVAAADCEGWGTYEFFESATLEEVQACLRAGADVDARDEDGDTPLHNAAWSTDNPAVIRALVNAGAEVGAREDVNSWTPLHLAASYNDNPAVIEALLDAGADVNAKDTAGFTPFIYAEDREGLEGSDAYRRLRPPTPAPVAEERRSTPAPVAPERPPASVEAELSLAEKLTTLESPRWRDREMTLRRFEFLLPRFVSLCPDATTQEWVADTLYVIYDIIKRAGIVEGLLEVFNNMYELTSEVSRIAALADAPSQQCAEIWAMYTTVRRQGMTSEDAKKGLIDVVRTHYFPGR